VSAAGPAGGSDARDAAVDAAGVIDSADLVAAAFNRRVGELLREVRKRRRLSLQDVEAQTGDEFKASVLGAYERGERALSLPRLDRLAEFYEVPIGRLVPGARLGVSAEDETPTTSAVLVLDVRRVSELEGPAGEVLARFVDELRARRGDLRGHRFALRASDAPAIAAMLDVPTEELAARLQWLGLLTEAV
jgi:transcriptional regulator with XRE-family HTH domain